MPKSYNDWVNLIKVEMPELIKDGQDEKKNRRILTQIHQEMLHCQKIGVDLLSSYKIAIEDAKSCAVNFTLKEVEQAVIQNIRLTPVTCLKKGHLYFQGRDATNYVTQIFINNENKISQLLFHELLHGTYLDSKHSHTSTYQFLELEKIDCKKSDHFLMERINFIDALCNRHKTFNNDTHLVLFFKKCGHAPCVKTLSAPSIYNFNTRLKEMNHQCSENFPKIPILGPIMSLFRTTSAPSLINKKRAAAICQNVQNRSEKTVKLRMKEQKAFITLTKKILIKELSNEIQKDFEDNFSILFQQESNRPNENRIKKLTLQLPLSEVFDYQKMPYQKLLDLSLKDPSLKEKLKRFIECSEKSLPFEDLAQQEQSTQKVSACFNADRPTTLD